MSARSTKSKPTPTKVPRVDIDQMSVIGESDQPLVEEGSNVNAGSTTSEQPEQQTISTVETRTRTRAKAKTQDVIPEGVPSTSRTIPAPRGVTSDPENPYSIIMKSISIGINDSNADLAFSQSEEATRLHPMNADYLKSSRYLSDLEILGFDLDAYADVRKDPIPDGEFMVTAACGVDSKIPEKIQLLVPVYHQRIDRDLLALSVAALTADQFRSIKDSDFDVVFTTNVAFVLVSSGLLAKRRIGESWEKDGDWRFTKNVVSGNSLRTAKADIYKNTELLNAICTLIVATKINYWNTNHHTSTGNNPLPALLQKLVASISDMARVNLTKEAVHAYGHWASTIQTLKFFNKSVKETQVIGERKYKIESSDDLRIRMESLPAGCHKLAFCNQVFSLIMKSTLHVFLTESMVKIMTETMKLYYEIKKDDTRYHVGAQYLTGEPRLPYDDNTAPGGMAICYVLHVMPGSTLAKSPYYLTNYLGGYKGLPSHSAEFESLVAAAAKVYATNKMKTLIGSALCEKVRANLSFDSPSYMAAECHHAILSNANASLQERIDGLQNVLDNYKARIDEKSKDRIPTAPVVENSAGPAPEAMMEDEEEE